MKHKQLLEILPACGIRLHRSRLECLSMLIVALIQARTVNLVTLSSMMESHAQAASVYRRLQRFFSELRLDEANLLQLSQTLHPQKSYSLCLDRTNWKFGKLNINILTLAYAHEGVAIPLLWSLLPKFGNSSTRERIVLLERLLSQMNVTQIRELLADREFIGRDWFDYLKSQQIPFVIRVRKDALGDEWFHLFQFFQHLPVGEHKVLRQRYSIFGSSLCIAGARLANGEYLIVVSNRSAANALASYAKRWQIECFFKSLKSSGFDLEATHLTSLERINTLLLVVSLSFVWALKVGEVLRRHKPIPIKKHGRKQQSVFRLGLDHLRHLFANTIRKKLELDECFRLLSCT